MTWIGDWRSGCVVVDAVGDHKTNVGGMFGDCLA
jgi:hypothetical protein